MPTKRALLEKLNDRELRELAEAHGIEVEPDLMQSVLGQEPDRERYIQVLCASELLEAFDIQQYIYTRSGKKTKRPKRKGPDLRELLAAVKRWEPSTDPTVNLAGELARHLRKELNCRTLDGMGGETGQVDMEVNGIGIIVCHAPDPAGVRRLDGLVNGCMETYTRVVMVLVGVNEGALSGYANRWRTWGAKVVFKPVSKG